jgi:hypothetical protein
VTGRRAKARRSTGTVAAALVILVVAGAILGIRHRNRTEAMRLANVSIAAEVIAMRGERLQLRGAAKNSGLAVVEPVGTADGHYRRLAPVPPLPDARFRIVSAEEARRIEAAPGPSLERASLYAGAGALDEAGRELERLKDTEPVRRLRDRVDNLR